MATSQTKVLSVTINMSVGDVTKYLADAYGYPVWANKFFTGPVVADKEDGYIAEIKMMGGKTHFQIEGDPSKGIFDLFFTRPGTPKGEPTRVRVISNRDGADVLWTLGRVAGSSAAEWRLGLYFMNLELKNLKKVLER